MVSRYPYIDRNPCILPAGKPIGDPCAKAKHCFTDVKTSEKVEALVKQYEKPEPKDYGPDRKGMRYYGVFSEIESSIRPAVKSQFEIINDEIKNTVYDSYWNAPLGKCRDPIPGLPAGMDIYCTTFGKPNKQSIPAGEVVHPKKTPGQVIYEDKTCHDLYKYTHLDYYPGERIDRNYAPPYDICNTFGGRSNADHSGSKTKAVMAWFNNDPISKVSRRQAAVRERTSAPIGQTLDKTGVSSMFSEYHTFGKRTCDNTDTVAELLTEFTPSALRRDVREYISYANRLRKKVHNMINKGDLMLEELYEELSNLDKEKTYKVHFDCISKVCEKFLIYLDRSKLEPLLLLLGILKKDQTIRYRDFLDFLDCNIDFPSLKREHYIMPPEYQEYDRQANIQEQKCKCKTYLSPAAGKPSIPKTPNPHFEESIVNIDHLGAETTSRAIISPSIYTQYGLSHRDFFKPRTKEFLAGLFKRIGCTLSDEDIDEIYAEGQEMDKTGGVCVETFKNILDVRAYKTYQRL